MVSGDAYSRGEKINSSKFAVDPGLSVGPVSNEVSPNVNKPTPAYRCKKCRRVVALQENVINHIPGEGEKCFEWQKRKSGNPFNRPDELECSSIFVEPLQWMKTGDLLSIILHANYQFLCLFKYAVHMFQYFTL